MFLVAVVGATGTGKTALAAALADRLALHLISCDAVQVYRDLSAATAKPEGDEARHPWALVSAFEPMCDVNLGDWVRAADAELRWAWRAGRTPCVVGGTGMYLRGLLKGVAPAPGRDAARRARLERLADRRGPELLHRALSRLDPDTAARIRPRDRQRLVRALEVRLGAGTSLTALQAGGWEGPDRYRALKIGLTVERERLYRRLDARVARFFDRGLIAEVRWLIDRIPPGANAWKAIGYRQVRAWIEAGADPARRDELVEAVRRETRRYAKRQQTWFRREPGVEWVPAEAPDLVAEVEQRVRRAAERAGPGRCPDTGIIRA